MFNKNLKKNIELYKLVFGTDDGEKVILDLMKLCHFQSLVHNKANPYQTAFNDGKRAVLLHILNMLKINEKDLVKLYNQHGLYEDGDNYE